MTETENITGLRVPPHSIEAEQALLGALLLSNRGWDHCANVVVEGDFYRHEHRVIFRAIGALIVANKEADIITVSNRLNDDKEARDFGGTKYLNALVQSVASGAGAKRYAEIVRQKSINRALISAVDEAGIIAWNEGEAVDSVDRITSLFSSMQKRQVRKEPRAIADIAIERIQHYEDLADGKKVAGWRTHIPALTAKLNGGVRPGNLYILAARPSVGKSSLAQDLGLAFAEDGLCTLFLSQEMADTEVADRGVANRGRLSYSALLTGAMNNDNWTRASEAMDALGKLPFFVDEEPSLTMHSIRAKAKMVKGLKVLILDYLQLCASTRKDGNRNSEIEEISRGLKTLAKELGIAVLALSQLNRDVEKRANRRPTMSDLRDSGAIEQDADVVMFLWPVREFPSEGRKIVGLGIDKNRQGRLGEFGLDFFGDVQRWQESEADIRPDPMVKGKGL